MSTACLNLHSFITECFSDEISNGTQTLTELSSLEHNASIFKRALLAFIILSLTYVLLHFPTHNDGLPIVNRRFFLEPRVFARIRWATKSRDILKAANEKVGCIGASTVIRR